MIPRRTTVGGDGSTSTPVLVQLIAGDSTQRYQNRKSIPVEANTNAVACADTITRRRNACDDTENQRCTCD